MTDLDVQVHDPGTWENEDGPKGWWAISDAHRSIFAYAATEDDAWFIAKRYRCEHKKVSSATLKKSKPGKRLIRPTILER